MLNCFRFFLLICFCFVVAICDQVHDVEAMHVPCQLLTSSGNLFLNMSDARETVRILCSFTGTTHISEKTFICF